MRDRIKTALWTPTPWVEKRVTAFPAAVAAAVWVLDAKGEVVVTAGRCDPHPGASLLQHGEKADSEGATESVIRQTFGAVASFSTNGSVLGYVAATGHELQAQRDPERQLAPLAEPVSTWQGFCDVRAVP